jgi:hypothetical protein
MHDDQDDYDYEAMATGHMRSSGTFLEWEDWFTEKGLGVVQSDRLVRGIYDRLHDRFFLSELDQIWAYVGRQKLKDKRSFFIKALEKPAEDIEVILRKVQRYEELRKLRGHNMDPASAERQIRLRDEFICDHIQERRTVEWMMTKEKMTRADVLEVWDRLRPGMDCPGINREGPDDWRDVMDAPQNWRNHDATKVLHDRGVEIAMEASKRKAAARHARGINRTDPEELTAGDIFQAIEDIR